MKILVLFLLCINSLFSFSEGKINKIDSLGHKQGLWIEYDSIDIEGYTVLAQTIPDSTGKTDFQKFIATKYEKIKHKGNYNDGAKSGLWQVYKPHCRLWMKIIYDSYGKRTKIEVFYSNRKVYISCDKTDTDLFEVKVFSKNGKLIKEKVRNKDYVNKLTETELYRLGL
jgi:hypothetical protein